MKKRIIENNDLKRIQKNQKKITKNKTKGERRRIRHNNLADIEENTEEMIHIENIIIIFNCFYYY